MNWWIQLLKSFSSIISVKQSVCYWIGNSVTCFRIEHWLSWAVNLKVSKYNLLISLSNNIIVSIYTPKIQSVYVILFQEEGLPYFWRNFTSASIKGTFIEQSWTSSWQSFALTTLFNPTVQILTLRLIKGTARVNWHLVKWDSNKLIPNHKNLIKHASKVTQNMSLIIPFIFNFFFVRFLTRIISCELEVHQLIALYSWVSWFQLNHYKSCILKWYNSKWKQKLRNRKLLFIFLKSCAIKSACIIILEYYNHQNAEAHQNELFKCF